MEKNNNKFITGMPIATLAAYCTKHEIKVKSKATKEDYAMAIKAAQSERNLPMDSEMSNFAAEY